MKQAVRAIAIIPAAGSSQRMGLGKSKLLCSIGEELVLQKTLNIISQSGLFEKILVPCRESDLAEFQALASDIKTSTEFFKGGESRQESVKIALSRINQECSDKQGVFVFIHDAARCFLSKELVQRALSAGIEKKAVSAAVECVDTVYQVDPQSKITKPLLERKNLKCMQTPQVFEFRLLWEAHQNAENRFSDDAGLVAQIYPVTLIEGEIANIKITNNQDLKLAELYSKALS